MTSCPFRHGSRHHQQQPMSVVLAFFLSSPCFALRCSGSRSVPPRTSPSQGQRDDDMDGWGRGLNNGSISFCHGISSFFLPPGLARRQSALVWLGFVYSDSRLMYESGVKELSGPKAYCPVGVVKTGRRLPLSVQCRNVVYSDGRWLWLW